MPPLPNASLDGPRVDALMGLTTQLVGGCLFIVLAILAFLLVRYRARDGHRAVYVTGATRLHAFGIAALALFTFIVMDLSLAGRANADLAARAHSMQSPDAFQVELMPAQFNWNVRYAGRDRRFATADDIVTLDDLRVPLNTRVVVQLVARDVIHSFFVPAFRVKQDAIPGRITRVSFAATRAGAFEIACAQLCGFGHYQMRGVVTVMPRDALDRWLAERETTHTDDPHDLAAHWGWPWAE